MDYLLIEDKYKIINFFLPHLKSEEVEVLDEEIEKEADVTYPYDANFRNDANWS